MDHKDVKVGMKVTPHSKTPDGRVKGLENSVAWKIAQSRGQNYLYVATRKPLGDYPECCLSTDYFPTTIPGDYFLCSDFERFKLR